MIPMPDDFTTHEEVAAVYTRRARRYDRFVDLYRLIGFRDETYRRRVVDALALRRGDTVVDIGCGTGLNFPLIQPHIGPEGRIIGVDLTQAMLDQAGERVAAEGWKNVELACSAAAAFDFPPQIDGVVSTCALTLEPEYDAVIAHAAKALKPGRGFALYDLKLPTGWTRYFAPLMVFLTRPLAVSMALAARHPWESMQRHLVNVSMTEYYGGFLYVAVGEAPAVTAVAPQAT